MFIDINDVSYWLEYHRGEQEKVPLVLLHGFTGSSKTWDFFVRTYKDKCNILVIDLPGHAKTGVTPPRTLEEFCQDFKVILDRLEITSINLLGYSLGGRVSLTFASMFPEYVRCLILESASPGLMQEEERTRRINHDEQLAKQIEREDLEPFIDFWENIPMFQTERELSFEIRNNIRKIRLGHVAPGLAQSLRYMGTGKQVSRWEDLKSLTMPVLLIVGGKDVKFCDLNQKMRKRLPNSRLKLVEDAGHTVHVKFPGVFCELVTTFLSTTNHKEE